MPVVAPVPRKELAQNLLKMDSFEVGLVVGNLSEPVSWSTIEKRVNNTYSIFQKKHKLTRSIELANWLSKRKKK